MKDYFIMSNEIWQHFTKGKRRQTNQAQLLTVQQKQQSSEQFNAMFQVSTVFVKAWKTRWNFPMKFNLNFQSAPPASLIHKIFAEKLRAF
jgi:hypothetical protein